MESHYLPEDLVIYLRINSSLQTWMEYFILNLLIEMKIMTMMINGNYQNISKQLALPNHSLER